MFSRSSALMAGTFLAAALSASAAQAQSTYTFDLPAQKMADALRSVGRQAGVSVAFSPSSVAGRQAPALRGAYSPEAALTRLLAGTGLVVRRSGTNTFLVEGGAERVGDADGPVQVAAIEEVVVTAKTGSQAVRKISGSVSAQTGAQLQALGAESMEDYLTRTPGVIFSAGIPGFTQATVRGVSTGVAVNNTQGTTGYFINDVPLTDPFFSAGIPDIDAFDVDNVTVLRGPQGTLFGSASMGGAINYQAAKPNLSRTEVRAQGTLQDTRDGSLGGSGKVMLNLPIVQDKLAVRGVFVHRQDNGYIDNVATGRTDVNDTRLNGGRFEVAFAPTDGTQLNYLFLQQQQNTPDLGYQSPGLGGPLRKSTLVPEYQNFRTTIHNLRLDQDLGPGVLTATATYHKKVMASLTDNTATFAPYLPGASPVSTVLSGDSHGQTFEVRYASRPGGRLDYLIGAFHDRTTEDFVQAFSAPNAAAVADAVYGPILGAGIGTATIQNGVFFQGELPFTGKEMAIFGEGTFHFNDQLKLTLGGRAFKTSSTNAAVTSGFFNILSSGSLSTTQSGDQSASGFTPKASLTWTPNEALMAYALVAKGFRFGGPNIIASTAFSVPSTYGSDSLVNYEAGVRTNLFDNRLQFDATAYYVDWSDIQLQLFTPLGLAYVDNAGKARTYGVEAVATWRPTAGLTLQSNVTYLNGALSEAFDPGAGQPIIPKGSTLPGASKWQVSNTVSYEWASAPLRPILLVSHRYVSKAPGDFSGGAPQGGYSQFDARATVHLDRFEITAFVDNIGNSRGVTSAAVLGTGLLEQFVQRPLTAGLTLDFQM